MCQALAQGGRRCAASTRPGYNRALKSLRESSAGPDRVEALNNARQPVLEHATTEWGAVELSEEIEHLKTQAPSGLRRKAFAAHTELIASLESIQRDAAVRSDMHRQVQAQMKASPGYESLETKRAARVEASQGSDRHRDAKARGVESRGAAKWALSGKMDVPMNAAGLKQGDQVLLPGQTTGMRDVHTVVSPTKFTLVADPNTGELVSQVEFHVRGNDEDKARTVYFNAYDKMTVRSLIA